MTEPTHHYRRDVAAQVDMLLAALLTKYGLDDIDGARLLLREELARAWSHGEHEGWRESGYEESRAQNPYGETDKA